MQGFTLHTTLIFLSDPAASLAGCTLNNMSFIDWVYRFVYNMVFMVLLQHLCGHFAGTASLPYCD